MVDGLLQRTGKEARGVVLEKAFSPEKDYVKFDITSAYDTKKLSTLERSFTFTRGQSPSLEIEDKVLLKESCPFEEALVIFGDVEKNPDGVLTVTYNGVSVRVKVETDCGPYEIVSERINEDMLGKVQPLRIGFVFKDKIKQGYFKLTVMP